MATKGITAGGDGLCRMHRKHRDTEKIYRKYQENQENNKKNWWIPNVVRSVTRFSRRACFAFESENCDNADIVRIIAEYLPNFEHIETGKSLDGKM